MRDKIFQFLKNNCTLFVMLLFIIAYVYIIRTDYRGADVYHRVSDEFVYVTMEDKLIINLTPSGKEIESVVLSLQHPTESSADVITTINLMENEECLGTILLYGDQYYGATYSTGNGTEFSFENTIKVNPKKVYTLEISSNATEIQNAFGIRLDENGNVWHRLIYLIFNVKERKLVTGMLAAFLAVSFYIWVCHKKNIFMKIENIFLLVSFVLCTLYLFFTPIFSVPDQVNHYVRAYGIAHGYFLTPADGNMPIPSNLIPFEWYTYSPFILLNNFTMQIDGLNVIMHDNVNMALYSPISYIFQVLGIGLADVISNNSHILILAGSLCNITGCTVLLYYAIKYIPYGKVTVAMISLLPMALQERASLSVDAITYAGVVALLAFCLYMRDKKGEMTKKQLILMYLLVLLVSSCKVVYFITAFAILLIPREGFRNRKNEWMHKVAGSALIFINSFGWLAIAGNYLENTRGGGSAVGKVKFIINSFGRYVYILLKTFILDGAKYIKQMIGSQLGSLDIEVDELLILCIIFVLCVVFFSEKYSVKEPDWFVRVFFLLISTGAVVLIATSLYIQWTAMAASTYSIEGIQGRYFLPILPFFTCAFLTCKTPQKKQETVTTNSVYTMYVFNLLVLMNVIEYTAMIR